MTWWNGMIDSSPNMVSILEILLILKIKIKLRIFYGQTLLKKLRTSRLEVFCRKSVLRNVAEFTGKHLRQSLFFNKVADLRQRKKQKQKQQHKKWSLLLRIYSVNVICGFDHVYWRNCQWKLHFLCRKQNKNKLSCNSMIADLKPSWADSLNSPNSLF